MERSPQRRRAIEEAKLAVRTYARDPSATNAAAVELAWQRVRLLKAVAEWRRPSFGRTPSPSTLPEGGGRQPQVFDDAIEDPCEVILVDPLPGVVKG